MDSGHHFFHIIRYSEINDWHLSKRIPGIVMPQNNELNWVEFELDWYHSQRIPGIVMPQNYELNWVEFGLERARLVPFWENSRNSNAPK